MGLFDEVVIHHSRLPKDAPEHVKQCPVFQTYDLGRGMDVYRIEEDGRVISKARSDLLVSFPELAKRGWSIAMPWKCKRIELWASNLRGGRKVGKKYRFFTKDGEPVVSVTYVVWIRDGKAGPVREVGREENPALPMSKF